MKKLARRMMVSLLDRAGYRISRIQPADEAVLRDLPEAFGRLRAEVSPFTMTSAERLYALYESVRYLERRGVPGAFVECGVWRGGSMMATARTLLELGSTARELVLFDTFSGMTPPTDADVSLDGAPASEQLGREVRVEGANIWCWASRDDVEANMRSTGYPMSQIRLVEGRVEDTIPDAAPERIALLRLDTDWYESTMHELNHLVPRLSPGGVLIIDDYGHWQGARRAVDEYFAGFKPPVLMHRIDYTGRIIVLEKQG